MTTDQRRSWLVATALFLMLVLSYSSTYLTMGIFFTPLIKNFGYGHAKVSELSTVAFLTTALFSWPAGWLIERIDSRFLISAGAVVIAAGFMTASQATHFGPLIAAYAIMGAGIGLGTIIPAAIVVTNWFDRARGKAMAFVNVRHHLRWRLDGPASKLPRESARITLRLFGNDGPGALERASSVAYGADAPALGHHPGTAVPYSLKLDARL
jgi:Major Facilitator Superfamily